MHVEKNSMDSREFNYILVGATFVALFVGAIVSIR
jgi:hypothetical protein